MRSVILLLALASLAHAEPAVTPIGRLTLLDGRVLKNAVIRSYDAQAAKALVLTDGRALLIPVNLLPAPYAEQLRARGNETTADLVQTSPLPPPAVALPAVPATPAPAPGPNHAPPMTPAPPAPVAPPADPRKAHREVAVAHAKRYYKFEYRSGSNAISVTDSDIAVGDTEEVTGWSNRYRTTGKVYLEIYDSVGGGSFRRGTSKFEILTEQKPGEEIKVIDFDRK